jgi:hypothetical protein
MPKPMRMFYQRLREQASGLRNCIHIEKHTGAERSLNQIRREERKDVYFVHFSNADGRSGNAAIARNRLLEWLKENLPDTPTEVLSPISIFRVDPPLADIRIDFDEAGLAKFCAEWELPDGTSRDPHFQCYIESFADWRAEIAGSMPSFDRPMTTTDCWFWDTPKGFLHHLDSATDKSNVVDMANPDDIWFLAGELVPEWRDVDMAEFVAGRIHYHMAEQQWRVYIGLVGFKHNAYSHFQRYDDYRLNPENQRRICEWFGLPPERVVFEEYDYF